MFPEAVCGKTVNMRNTIVIVATILVFAGVVYGSALQDRMRRKAHKPGTSIFSVGFMFRSLATKEAVYFVLLTLAIAVFVATIIAMDEAGYLPR
jgi:hypothetical protein